MVPWFCVLIGLLSLASGARAALPPQALMEPPRHTDRILVVAPHPDDEVLGCGGLLQQAVKAGASVRVVLVTNGDAFTSALVASSPGVSPTPKAHLSFGRRRARESLSALRELGVEARSVTFLGYPDTGLSALLLTHWAQPFRSPYTGAEACPYREALRPGRAYLGMNLYQDLVDLLREFRPTRVFLPDPLDQNRDHWAVSCLVTAALWEVAPEALGAGPQRVAGRERALWPVRARYPLTPGVKAWTYLIHYGDYPTPQQTAGRHLLQPPLSPSLSGPAGWHSLWMDPSQRKRKALALAEYRTQRSIPRERRFLDRFAMENEPFRALRAVALETRPLGLLEPVGTLAGASTEGGADILGLRLFQRGEYLEGLLTTRRPAGRAVSLGLNLWTLGDRGRVVARDVLVPARRRFGREVSFQIPLPAAPRLLLVAAYSKVEGVLADRSGWYALLPEPLPGRQTARSPERRRSSARPA